MQLVRAEPISIRLILFNKKTQQNTKDLMHWIDVNDFGQREKQQYSKEGGG